jgi:hypothetical protein
MNDVAYCVRNVQTLWRDLLPLTSGRRCPILKIKAAVSSETLVPIYKTTWRYNSEENNLQLFQVARVVPFSVHTVTDSNLCLPQYRHSVWNGQIDGDPYHSSEHGYR